MKITAIKTYTCGYHGRTRSLIKVETDEALYGWGEAFSVGPDLAVKPIVDYIATWCVGEDPRRIEYLMMKTHQQLRFPPGSAGLSALSGIEHALWDISGKAAGLPVYMLLGGAVRDRVRVYHALDGATAEDTAERAHAFHDRCGITAFKLGPYRMDPEASRWGRVCAAAADYFEGVRVHTPEAWEFAFDLHTTIFEPIRALQLTDALAPYDPLFCEEPLRPENIRALARLRQKVRVPLATGEQLYMRFEFLDVLAAGAADILQPDVCVCGGLLEMRKIAAIAEAHYVTVAPHNPMGPIATAVNFHFAAATHNFKILEYIDPTGSEWDSCVDDPYLPVDGHLELRDRPGLGIDVNEDVIARSPYVHWQRRASIRPDGATGYT